MGLIIRLCTQFYAAKNAYSATKELSGMEVAEIPISGVSPLFNSRQKSDQRFPRKNRLIAEFDKFRYFNQKLAHFLIPLFEPGTV